MMNIISIDFDIYNKMKEHGAIIYAIHHHTVHLLVCGKLITIGCFIPEGKHHIVIDQNIEFNQTDIKMKDVVYVDSKALHIGQMTFSISKEVIKSFSPYNQTYLNTKNFDVILDNLFTVIENHMKESLSFNYSDSVTKFISKRVNQFLNNPNYEHAISILGLGQGLTPYGDDILVGYIMGRNSVGVEIDWLENLLNFVDEKTTLLSAQNIKDTHEKLYPYLYIQMIEDLFNNNKIDHAKKIMEIGATSGTGILLGFLHGIKRGEPKNERF